MEAIGLEEWLDAHNITYTLRKDVLVIPEFGRCFVQKDFEHIFQLGKEGDTSIALQENVQFLLADDIPYVVFPFGRRWFYIDIREDLASQDFKVLRYVGKPVESKCRCRFYPLGIHTGHEILNGSGLLKDWCAKARFLGYEGISVADRNTLASSLSLQNAATEAGMLYCFGYSLSIRIGNDLVGAMIYSASQKGFRNLLRIQKVIAVDNPDTKEISLIELLAYAEGNTLVFDKWSGHWLAEHKGELADFTEAFDGWVFFQVDYSEYKAERIDSALLESQKAYFDNFSQGGLNYYMNIRPVLIPDVYYLDKEDCYTKIVLNKIDTGASHEQSQDQYLKTLDELYEGFQKVFSDKYGYDVFRDMCESTGDIIENATAAYDLKTNFMPQYQMTKEEQKKYGTNLNMFNQLIEEGFRRLVPDGEQETYRSRVEYEKYVILSTNNLDYFLIQYDTINWARKNGILVGIGRGSAGGSLVLYLLGITCIDPIHYNLLFERFLLPERGGLESAEVTMIEADMESENYVEIECDNGKIIRFDADAQFLVKRGEQIKIVYADELQPDDEIVWDRKDELFSFND